MAIHFAVVFAALGLAYLSASRNQRISIFPKKKFLDERPPRPTEHWNVFDYVLVAGLIVFSGIRYFVGSDYLTYLNLHLKVDLTDLLGTYLSSPVEVGYTTLSILVRTVTDFPFAIFWVTSALTVIPMYVAIKRMSLDLPFSIFIYMVLALYVSPFNMVRQGIAISLVFLGHSFYEKNRTAYFVLNALAGLFHYTAWLAALIQWIFLRWRPSSRRVLFAIAGFLLAALAGALVALLFPRLVPSILESINPRYADDFENARSGIGTYLIVATRLALLYLVFLLTKRSGESWGANWARYGPWITFVALGVCFLMIGTQAVTLGRIDYYFSVYLVVLIPNLVNVVRTTQASPSQSITVSKLSKFLTEPRNVKAGFLIFGSLYFAIFIVSFSDLVPYQTYFGH